MPPARTNRGKPRFSRLCATLSEDVKLPSAHVENAVASHAEGAIFRHIIFFRQNRTKIQQADGRATVCRFLERKSK